MRAEAAEPQRRNDEDVSGRVRVSDPAAVEKAVAAILGALDPAFDRRQSAAAFQLYTRIYTGREPDYVGCDTWYHDAQHSLDVTLATARLIDGHDRGVDPPARLGARRALLGVIGALFHDVGYVRRIDDAAANGAEYTLSHVERSGAMLESLLPGFGFAAEEAALMHRLIHFTGYEMPLDAIAVDDRHARQLGFLIASADLLAQTADRCYLEKCRDFLYPEFVICGLAGSERMEAATQPTYLDVTELLNDTPDFNARLWRERLDGYFDSAHQHLGTHFGSGYGGANPYRAAIRSNLSRIRQAIEQGSHFERLRRRPRAIQAAQLAAISPDRPATGFRVR